MKRNKGGTAEKKSYQSNDTTSRNKTLKEMGITKDQSVKWRLLAKVPEAEFEHAINLPGSHPSTNHIVKKPSEAPRIDAEALYWFGRLRELNNGHFNTSLNECLDNMTDAMRHEALKVIPKLQEWVNNYE